MLWAEKTREKGSLSSSKNMHYQRKESTVLYSALQRHNTENSIQIFPEKELRGLSPIKDKVRKLCWAGQKGEGRAVGEDRRGWASCWRGQGLEEMLSEWTEVRGNAVGVDRSGRKSCRSGQKWEEKLSEWKEVGGKAVGEESIVKNS